ncbi:Structural maintenance of chromosomes protein 2 [Hypsibius exemplaris]|uniref:Structural maintenance of chromosomes protein n=1 Tax=Hypsibius exemplaris TaxID=2072580 RepID=A0A1W0WJM9_HYPEX|nr:Structural maintenance of chromosomes protein 2 [Hypsibius exemplaris]
MHIKSIKLHGFKSYGTETLIKDFNPQFNAITGLNGCGKSNILDAICFVLCQNSPTQFRADNMMDLVYKKGAGGIAFASVSIVFDNKNKNQSPINYKEKATIEVERRLAQGKSTYHINGAKVNQNVVQDMFRSIQLNIQSPHFLIMQGRITKVLNMKPEEIWNMVEEGAGTMVYITKRDATKRIMSDKEKRVMETQNILHQVIEPKIETLQKTRQEEIERNKAGRNIEKLQYNIAAKEAFDHKIHAEQIREERKLTKLRITELETQLAEAAEQLAAKAQQITELEHGDTDQSAALKVLEAAAAEARKKWSAIKAEIDSNRSLIEEEESAIEQCRRDIETKKVELVQLTERQAKIGEDLAAAEAKKGEMEGQVLRAQQAMAVIVTGVGGRDNADFGWKNQCTAAQEQLNELELRLNVVRGTLTNHRKQVATVSQESASKAQSHQKMLQNIQTLEQEIAVLREKHQSVQPAEGAAGGVDGIAAVRQEQRDLLGRKAHLENQIGHFENQMRSLEVPFRNGGQNRVDLSRVHGSIAKLFVIKEHEKFLTAIDGAAGGKIYQFVVDNEEVGKTVLDNVCRRVTLAPISRAKGHPMPDAQFRAVQQLVGANKVWRAIDCVTYEPKFRSIAEYTFGSTIICADIDTANTVAYDQSGRFHRPYCVTLGGDTVHPDGLVAGGSTTSRDNMQLNHVYKHRQFVQEYDELRVQLNAKQAQLADLERTETEVQRLNADIHQRTNQLNVLIHEAERNQGVRNLLDAERLKKEIQTLETELNDGEARREELTAKINDLKTKLSAENAVDLEKADAEKHEAKCRENVRKQTEAVNKVVQRQMECQTNIDNNLTASHTLTQEIADHKRRVAEYEAKILKKQETLAPVEAEHDQASKRYNDHRSGVAQKSVQLQEAHAEKRNMEKDRTKLNRDLDKAKSDLDAQKNQLKAIENRLNEELFKEHEWLGDEYTKLGTPESAYKVEEMNMAKMKQELEKCLKRRKELDRALGQETNCDFENIQRQYEELKEKNRTCHKDKEQLENIIQNLDIKKRDLIELAVTEVNKHFGKIFESLLPNANCMLEREKDSHGNLCEALRIRVALGNSKTKKDWLWKESLSELSGGQRSLVALSLILAMLKMNPAPVYVLDEIDAALDLSHTQNVGKMIRMHFKQSQFIVVSLKEGMFNNANIVFRVGFQDGVSKVTAKVNDKAALDDEADDAEEDGDEEDDE